MPLKIVHAADLHLGSRLRGLMPYEGAPVGAVTPLARGALERAMGRLTTLCIEEGARLLVIAGDLFDGHHRLYATGLRFVEELLKLQRAGVRTVWVRGNHDAASRVLKNLLLPQAATELGLGGPASLVLEDLGVVLHGFSYPERSVTEDLSVHYPAPLRDLVNLGVLHTSAEGRPGHDPYAPTRVRRLVDHGYDYWALGHVHQREEAHVQPWVVYPGNLQGRSMRERGPKGATVVTVDEGRIIAVEPRALDGVRFELCSVDIRGTHGFDDVAERAATGLREVAGRAPDRPLIARLLLRGGAELGALFSQSPSVRLTALQRVAAEVGAEGPGIWLEETWAELSEPPGGRWRLGPLEGALAA